MTPDATPPELPEQGIALPSADAPRGPPRPRRGGRLILFAGVAGACALGAGLGLWARPGMSERMATREPAPAAHPVRTLQVVFDDRLAPDHPPMQEAGIAPTPTPAPMTLPTFSPARLNAAPKAAEAAPRVEALPAPAVQTASVEPPAKPFAAPKLAPMLAAAFAAPRMLITRIEAPKPPPILLAKADPPPTADADRAAAKAAAHRLAVSQAKAQAAKAQAAKEEAAAEAAETRLAQARTDKAKAAQVRLAQAEAAKADHLAKLAQIQADRAKAKAGKAEAVRLAQAEAKGRAEARAEGRAEALAEAKEEARKQIRLASLVRTLKRVLPHDARPQPAPVQTARLDRRHGKKAARHDALVQQASLKPHKSPHIVEPPSRSRAVNVAPPQHPSGLMKVSAPRCGQRDPGEALVCADPNLGAADRQLARAYQGARAAGVPDGQLQAQQQRWLAARSAAAREAPWAVRDVYMARIAELNGLARDAHGDGYE
jgi:hypothetical protein